MLLLLAAATPAATVDITLEWTPPTEYADGTPLPPGAIAGYHLKWGRCEWLPAYNFYTLEAVSEYTLPNLDAAYEYCFQIRTIGANGLLSPFFPPEGPRRFRLVPATPESPDNVRVAIRL